jgi:hypothetical protein
VKEASSGLIANVAGQVRARVEMASQAKASSTPRQSSDKSLVDIPPGSQATDHGKITRLFWVLIPALMVLAVLAYWFLMRSSH